MIRQRTRKTSFPWYDEQAEELNRKPYWLVDKGANNAVRVLLKGDRVQAMLESDPGRHPAHHARQGKRQCRPVRGDGSRTGARNHTPRRRTACDSNRRCGIPPFPQQLQPACPAGASGVEPGGGDDAPDPHHSA